jgi:uncharacterized protein
MKRSQAFLGSLALVLVLTGMTVGAGNPNSIVFAAMQGDRAQVLRLLEEGADVNEVQGDGMSALHWVAMRGDVELASILLSAGAKLEGTTRLGRYTPLHLAAKEGHSGMMVALLDAGADWEATTSTGGANPLLLAAGSGANEGVQALLQKGADPNFREAEWGQTALIFAASWNRPEVIRTLLQNGADPTVATRVHQVPALAELHGLAREAAQKVLTQHREVTGEPAGTWRPTVAQAREAAEAAREVLRNPPGDIEVDEVEEGTMNQNELVGAWGGLTPLLHAVRQGHKDAALALLEGGAPVNQASAGDGTSPLLMAAINGQFDLGMLLLEHGADPNMASDAGATPLYAAIERVWTPRARYPQVREHEHQEASHLDLMRALMDRGADPNVRLGMHLWYMAHTGCGNFNCGLEVVWGATPFWRAAYGLDIPAMRLLVEYGADPNIPTRRPPERGRSVYNDELIVEGDPSGLPPIETGGAGVFPIHAASGVGYGTGFGANAHVYAQTGFLPAIRYLVEELGIDVNTRDYQGFTPVHHAAARGDNRAILYLVEQGADVTVVGRSGQTTVDLANGPVQRISPFPATIRLLESMGAKNNNRCVSC